MKWYYLAGILIAALFAAIVMIFPVETGSAVAHPLADPPPATTNTTVAPASITWIGEVSQSSRNGNWDIYYRPYAKDPQPLTAHPAADTLPRLNIGGTQVLFVSDRDGNDEIYRINIDGTHLTRLTTDSTKDTLPYWSPDGTQLVFTSYRTGNGDLYLMKADGTTLRQFTTDGAEDTYPMWSPDGTQLLWVRLYPVIENRPQEGELWLANADGSNPHPLTGRLITPARVLISPDGAHIAFDADFNQDGFPDIVLMDRDGGNMTLLVPGHESRHLWMGTWDTDSLSLWTTKFVYHTNADDTRDLDYTIFSQVCLNAPLDCENYFPPIDPTEMLPDRQLADLLVPVSHVEPLPVYARLKGFMVNWVGKEYGPSGLVGFDIQYRRTGDSDWQYLWRGTVRNPDTLPATPNPEEGGQTFVPPAVGHYYFRSRTLDYAGNYEPWPTNEDGDTATTVFSWYLSGQVTDGRGVPYAQQTIPLQPAALDTPVTDQQGAFQVRIGEPGPYTLAQEFALQMDRDRAKSYYRLPADNSLQNGGFEQPLSQGWQISGTVALTTSVVAVHSGSQAVQLGQSCPLPCLTALGQSGVDGLAQQFLVVAPNGILHLFAIKRPGTLIHQTRTPDGHWSPYVPLANDIGGWSPAALFDQKGDLQLVWSAVSMTSGIDDTLTYARYRQGQGWSQPEILGPGGNPKLALDTQQQLHLLYRCINADECQLARIGYRKQNTAGAWSAPKILSTENNLVDYAIATTGNTVNISWIELNNSRSLDRLLVGTLTANGEFSSRQPLDVGTTPDAGFSRYEALYLLADSQQRLHLVGKGRNEGVLYTTMRLANGSWDPLTALYPLPDLRSFALQSVMLDQQGILHFVLLRSSGEPSFHLQRTATGHWLPAEPFFLFNEANLNVTATALGLDGELYFAMQNFEPVTQLKSTAVVTAQSESTLAQTVTIPPALHQPTLSFLYQLQGNGDHGSAFAVAVQDGISTTTVFSTAVASDWQLGWADLTPWQGQTVTVTFAVAQAVGDRYLQATLDRVSLGSWRTPLPEGVSPTVLAWGVSATITVTGTNFIASPQIWIGERQLTNVHLVNETTLTALLPSDLAPGRYRVWIVNPGGERAAAASLLRVGNEVLLPAVYAQ